MPIPAVPTLLLAVAGMALVLARWVAVSRWYEGIWLAAMVGAIALIISGPTPESEEARRAIWSSDALAIAGQSLALLYGILFGLGSFGVRSIHDQTAARLAYLSFLIAGAMLVSASNDLITLALSVEIVQFASWALRKVDRFEQSDSPTGLDPGAFRDENSFWLGIATSGCLWLGIALLANVVGSTQYDEIRQIFLESYIPGTSRAVIGSGSKLGLVAIGLIIAGFGSRMGLVPWHAVVVENSRGVSYWTAGCVTLGGQLAAVLGLARLCGTVWIGYRDEILVMLLVVAGLSFVASAGLTGLGLVGGEGRLRRWMISIPMLQGAWLTIGLMSATAELGSPSQSLSSAGGQPGPLALILFAVGASQVALTGLFLVFSYLAREDRQLEFVDELLGLARMYPVAAAVIVVLLASVIGQPPLWGFWANWLLMVSGVNVRAAGVRENTLPHIGIILLMVVAIAATLVAAGVLLRFVRTLLLEQLVAQRIPHGRRSALMMACCCALMVLAVGLFPARVIHLLDRVRGPDAKSAPDNPSGSNRGAATAATQ